MKTIETTVLCKNRCKNFEQNDSKSNSVIHKKVIYHISWGFFWECKIGLTLENQSVQYNHLKAEKVFVKIHHQILIKTHNKLEIQRDIFNLIKDIHCLASQVALEVKNPPANAGATGSIPGSGRSPGRGHGNPL